MKNIKVALFVVAALALLSACGGSGTSPGSSSGATTGTGTTGSDGGGTTTGGTDSGGSGGTTDSGVATLGKNVSFDLSDAVGIFMDQSVSADVSVAKDAGGIPNSNSKKSNLHKLKNDGTVVDLFVTDVSLLIDNFFISPDGNLYLVFKSVIYVDTIPCTLVMLGQNQVGECVDDTLVSVDTKYQKPTAPIQFDSSDNIYYSGLTKEGKRVLRKLIHSSKKTVDLIDDNISIRLFLVLQDGTVYLAGTTASTQTSFFRRILPSGKIENLINGSNLLSLYTLPDGNVYAGDWGIRMGVVKVTSAGVEDDLYIGELGNPVFDTSFNEYESCDYRTDNPTTYASFCGYNGTAISAFYRSVEDEVFVVAGSGDTASLWQYWPEVKPISTSVYRPTIVSGTMSTLLIAGYDTKQKNKLIAFNTTNSSEVDLLKGVDIEIYHFGYSASKGTVIFDGLRFSDGVYIVGSIDTENGNNLTVLTSGTEYEDVQFFQ
ncbi:MAG: hypothetical protein V2A66_06830 [Pseudomonadota bacterium]